MSSILLVKDRVNDFGEEREDGLYYITSLSKYFIGGTAEYNRLYTPVM